MSQVTAGDLSHGGESGHHHDHGMVLSHENTHLPAESAERLYRPMMVAGVILAVVCLVLGVLLGNAKHAILSYHVGAIFALGLPLGALGLVMITHAFNAGWSVSLRRQMENITSLLPVALLLMLPSILAGLLPGWLFKWSDPNYTEGDVLAEWKAPYLDSGFLGVRLLVFVGVWLLLSRAMVSRSKEQDVSGDKWITKRLNTMSSWGLVLYALTCAFFSFDWIMSLDFHWFSTMFPVYFFAGNLLSATALVTLVCALLVRSGRLKGLVTPEHFHDLGKLLFAFTVFWAYIAFCQYFLIWYSNIPEETAWYLVRRSMGWESIFLFLCFGKFIGPFLVLIWRDVKRHSGALIVVCLWMLATHAIETFWVIRPTLYKDKMGDGVMWLVDLAGLLGPALILGALLARRVASGVLVPTRDPRLHEAMEHRNYV